MERLVEKSVPADAAEAQLVDLLRASEPHHVSVARKQQVLMRVLEQRRTKAKRASVLLRPVIIVGVLLAAGVTAAGTVGHSLIARGLRMLSAEPPSEAPLRRPSKRAHLAPIAVSEESEPSQPSVSLQARPGPKGDKIGDRLRARGEDPSRVVGAIKALRSDHDPVHAGKLLAEYLKIYPHGALLEEALALSIEAAAARRDPLATAFAERYLTEFPNGRFRRAAEQALQHRP